MWVVEAPLRQTTVHHSNLYYATRASGAAGYTGPTIVCAAGTCLATSDQTPSLALTAAGAPIIAFHGTDNHVYTTGWNGTKFDNPIDAVFTGETSTKAPVLTTGIGTAAAAFFDSLAQFYRRAYLRWIDATKRRPDQRPIRIAEMIDLLEQGKKERPK